MNTFETLTVATIVGLAQGVAVILFLCAFLVWVAILGGGI